MSDKKKPSISRAAGRIEKQLAGYQAAGRIIVRMLASAEIDNPSERVDENSKEYCAGYYAGLNEAHGVMVLGEFPNVRRNAAMIRAHS